MEEIQQPIKQFIKKYYEDKNLYLNPNTKNILQEVKNDAKLSGLTTRDILILKNTLFELSRIKQYRFLKGRKPFSTRSYINFSPGTNTSHIHFSCGHTTL